MPRATEKKTDLSVWEKLGTPAEEGTPEQVIRELAGRSEPPDPRAPAFRPYGALVQPRRRS